MEYPKYLKGNFTKQYVKLIDENNNIYFRYNLHTDSFAMDYNGSPNKNYNDLIGCSRAEFEEAYIEIMEKLNKISKI